MSTFVRESTRAMMHEAQGTLTERWQVREELLIKPSFLWLRKQIIEVYIGSRK